MIGGKDMFKNSFFKIVFFIFSFFVFLGQDQCPDGEVRSNTGEIENNIIRIDVFGDANSNNSTNAEDWYPDFPPNDPNQHGHHRDPTGPVPDPAQLKAEINGTKASSAWPVFNRLAGSAEAISTPLPESERPNDPMGSPYAVGRSFNKVVSNLRVTQSGSFTFKLDIKLEGIEMVHKGCVEINVQANVVIPEELPLAEPPPISGAIAHANYLLKSDPNNPGQVKVYLDQLCEEESHPADSVLQTLTPANGNPPSMENTIQGPNAGLILREGNYNLELSLRVFAKAKIPLGELESVSKAKVENAEVRIALRD